MFSSASVVSWLGMLGVRPGGLVDVHLVDVGGPGRALPEFPDRAVIATLLPGAGATLQGLYERPAVQLRVRWERMDLLGCEHAALTIDRAVLTAETCTRWPDGTRLLDVQRSGGRPALLDVDEGDRPTFACTYVLEIHDPEGAH